MLRNTGRHLALLTLLVGFAAAFAAPASAQDADPVDESGWMQQVDEAFGTYLVGPLAKAIFFDFGIGVPFVVFWLFAGALFLTLRMGFINIRAFRHAIALVRGVYDKPGEGDGEVSHFQALAAALSATVGLGNIAGVAIAIGAGGPGACFWLIVVGLLGMSAKFAECSLGQIYRTTDKNGNTLGGPMRYLRVGLAEMGLGPLGKVLSVLFMVLCIGASFGGGNAFQIGQSLEVINSEIPVLQTQPWIYGLVMAVAVGVVIIGGIKSIGAVAGKIVPVMCVLYVLACLYILLVNASAVPAAFGKIITEAFTPDAAYGGFLGVLVLGVRRAVFSNEAGVGSAAIAHSAAKTDEPISEGIVALLEPFIDTVVVCTITALVVIVTGAYKAPETADAIAASQGAAVTLHAFEVGGTTWFKYILYAAVVLFAYSTCISWSYYGERSFVNLFGESSSIIYKLLFLLFTFLGSVVTRGNILDFSDLMILGMSFPNLLGVFLMSGLIKRRLDDYWGRVKSGEIKRFDG
ncbi:MAG: alanine/glycine:cation symporter family protein [Planctomycetota bacterium]